MLLTLLVFPAMGQASTPLHVPGSWLGQTLEGQLEQLTREPITAGNQVRLYVDGPEFYPVRLDLIRNASETIDLSTFLWCDDEAGLAVANALADAARRGVRVRVMVDAFNNKPHERAYRIMDEAGVKRVIFNPVYWGIQNVFRRIHEKILVVDGETALMGGANLCDEYMLVTAARGLWRDLEVKIQGPVIGDIQRRMDGTWNWMARRENLAATRPGLPALQLIPVYDSPTPVSLEQAGTHRAAFHYQQSYVREGDDESFIEAFASLIDSARERVILYDPYLIPPKRIERALIGRARQGKEVVIVTNSLGSNDMGNIIVSASLSHYGRLMKAGVKIYESKERTFHAKALLVDGDRLSVGSHNLTNHSHRNNGESNLLTDSPEAIARFLEMYRADIAGDEIRLVTRRDLIERADSLGEGLYLTIGTWFRNFF